jgi:hypothetical protein
MAEADLSGLYRALLRVVTPGLLAPRLPRIQAQYLNFGSLEVLSSGQKDCEVVRHDHPHLLVHWYVAVVHGFLPCVLQFAGATNVRVRWNTPEPEGVDDAGFERVALRFAIHWA